MLLVFVYFFVTAVAVVTSQWVPFSPEETLFSYTRCAEDHFGKDYKLMAKWMIWELPQDEKSACYAKCVLVKLELFDETSKSFRTDHILEQFEKYKQYSGQDEQGVKDFAEAVKGLGSTDSADCGKVAQAYAPVFEKFKDVQRNVYFGKKEITDKIYEADATVKKRDETIFRFCEKKSFENGKVTSCTLRKTGITMSNKHLDCLYRGMRYLDRSGNINSEEIKRDLHLVGVKDKDAEVDQALNNCKVKEESKASDYNGCLWKSPSLRNHLTSALDYREVRSESYRYFLTGPKPYDVDDVKAKVAKYDQDAGCT